MGRKFEGGLTVMTAGVCNLVANDIEFSKQVIISLKRHFSGDWGDIDEQDKKLNDFAVDNNDRIFSAYNGVKKIWIITESDRSSTCVLFPSEY